jgi:hypothetical protein
MKLLSYWSALILAGALTMPLLAQSDTAQDARKVRRDQAYINRQKRQRNRAAVNGNVGKAVRKNRNAQLGRAKRAKDIHDLKKDEQK